MAAAAGRERQVAGWPGHGPLGQPAHGPARHVDVALRAGRYGGPSARGRDEAAHPHALQHLPRPLGRVAGEPPGRGRARGLLLRGAGAEAHGLFAGRGSQGAAEGSGRGREKAAGSHEVRADRGRARAGVRGRPVTGGRRGRGPGSAGRCYGGALALQPPPASARAGAGRAPRPGRGRASRAGGARRLAPGRCTSVLDTLAVG
mmetsp:Transcript_3239/g.9659  ORF Transcript_3239/g.9659 Transcript_3239/m.9659 type:complete len:203 (-) Transcript_3239:127-735(-)